jgi:hypothetical protein
MKKQFLLSAFFLLTLTNVFCQQFLPPVERFSTKKAGYLITIEGKRIDFILDDLDRKKGLIIKVEGKPTDGGKKFVLKADQIKELAIPGSDFAKFAALSESTKSIAKMKRTNTKEFNRELVYFFQEYLEDRKITALMQIINPDFSSKIVVYHDPFASETMGLSVGGIQVTGGIDKSYYFKIAGKTQRYFKKDYDDDFKKIFASCADLLTKYKDFAWRDLPLHLFFFDTECK